MAYLLATDVAIHLGDGEPRVNEKIAALDDAVLVLDTSFAGASGFRRLQTTLNQPRCPALDGAGRTNGRAVRAA
jgi:hypothetical protein